MKVKMAFLYKPKDPRIEEVVLSPLKADQVLVKVGACGICGSDIECYEGKSAEGRYDLGPYTPGHSGRVRLIGHSIGRKVPVEIGKTIWKTLSITGSGGTKDFGQRTIRFMSKIRETYNFEGLNTHHYPFEKLNEAVEFVAHNPDKVLKCMLTF